MRHLGDITKLNGAYMEPVNVIIGGSPCQDLSIAGRREGLLDGERSSLFMEQIRLIKEMRNADILRGRSGKDIRPRFMVWENVPGAFSSNKGRDFAVVLEETVRVVFEEAPDIPVPKNGWPTAGCISVGGDRPVSVAYRVLDSQFWGVAQRRRRISLVADFAGGCAPEILFEREGCGRDHQAERKTWERIAPNAQTGPAGGDREGAGANTYTLKIRSGCEGGGKGALIQEDLSATLSTLQDQTLFQPVAYLGETVTSPTNKQNPQPGDPCHTLTADTRNYLVQAIENHPNDSRVTLPDDNMVQTLTGRMGTGGGNVPLVMQSNASSLETYHCTVQDDIAHTLKARDYKDPHCVGFSGEGHRYIVRRLTPLECERLQGFPDGWTDIGDWTDAKGKKRKGDADAPRYKALGNSIAIPPWCYVLTRLSLVCGGEQTMGSLFDGIGGFPLIWETINGKNTCLWASEIEDFPIAVTQKRFNGEEQT